MIRLALASLALSIVASSPASAELAAELDALASSAFPPEEPGAAVVVLKAGEVVLRKGYGLADLELGISIEPDMVFRIGSVTKQFTAAAVLLLEERGKISVTDDIRDHLPSYPTEGRVITIEHLLTHTSGIRSYTDMERFGEIAREDLEVDEMIAFFENEPLAFEPGEKYAYNNSGYFLLGAIIEKVSGQSYEAFLRENVFAPLGMKDTLYDDPGRVIERRAKGYEERETAFRNAEYLSMRLPYAAGSLASTVDDLAIWDQALYSTDLLSEESLDKLWRPYRLRNGASTFYGYGFGLSTYEGRPVVAHGGGINGFACYVLRMPEDRVYVAVLTNRNADRPSPSLLARKLAAKAIGKPIVEPEKVALPAATLERYTGVYRVDSRAKHVVTFEDGRLYLRRYGDEHPEGGRVRDPGPSERLNRVRAELMPASPTEFFFDDSLMRARFEDEGRTLLLTDWGREERAEKTSEGADDRSQVLVTIETLFEGMRSRDAEAIRSVLDPGARIVSTSSRDGRPVMRASNVAEFVQSITGREGPTLDERIWDPEVRLVDHLATVWAPYDFHIGNELSHCGEDAFQLARTTLGWKILAIAYTRREEGCSAPPEP